LTVVKVAVIDYGMGNVGSIRRALVACGAEPVLAASPHDATGSTHLVLPGVGAFPDGMRRLHATGWAEFLRGMPTRGGPLVLGICLGMQILFEHGDEVEPTEGLGLLAGSIRRLVPGPDERLPHVGWNGVDPRGAGHVLLANIPAGTDFYFVHSYQAAPDGPHAIATCDYAGGLAAAVAHGNLLGVQFHPEKSQRPGLQLLRNFLGMQPC